MNNVLLDALPTSWNGYEVNTWFQIGIQASLVYADEDLDESSKGNILLELLFSEEDGSMRDYPQDIDELTELLDWFLNGWYHDNKPDKQDPRKRIMDYDIDQWRIYADFLQIYHIDLNQSDMHWWTFQGLLWNMPREQSSFMQVLEIRQKKPRPKATADEKKAISAGHKVYDLKPLKKQYTAEEKSEIDAYDEMMRKIKAQQALEKLKE